MTDNEIIKALEYCSSDISNCKKCPYLAVNCCTTVRCRDVLTLVERQQAEIEMLNNNMDAMVKEHHNIVKSVKEDTIREFEEKVKAKMTKYNEADGSYSFNVLTTEDITLIAKEMKERKVRGNDYAKR